MLEDVKEMARRYLDVELVAESALALAATCSIRFAVYDLDGKAVFRNRQQHEGGRGRGNSW